MPDNDDRRTKQIRERLERAAQETNAPVTRFASLKVRPMRLGKTGKPEQSYLDGYHYSDIRHQIDQRFDRDWRRGPQPLRFEEHESGPELIIDLAHLGLDAIAAVIAIIGCVVAVLDRKKQAPSAAPPTADQVSVSLRTVDGNKIREMEITVIASGEGVEKAADQAKKVIGALEKAAKKK